MNIAVFCSQYDVADKYKDAAATLARLIAGGGHTLIFGGGDEGLMHVMAEGVHIGGGKVLGVMREAIKDKAYKDADELIVVPDAREMNRGIIERGEVIIVLVGGIGTLNEVTDVLRATKNGTQAKPVVMVNTDNFYEGFKQQLQRMSDEGFLRDDVMSSVRFADTPEDAMRYITTYGN